MPAFKMNTIEKESSFYNSNTNSNNAIITYRDFVEQNQKQKTLFDIVKLNVNFYKLQFSVAIFAFIFISSTFVCGFKFGGWGYTIPFLIYIAAAFLNAIYFLIVSFIITMTTDPDLTLSQRNERVSRLRKKFYAEMVILKGIFC